MKKQGILILVLITGIFAACVTGLFIGRNMNRQKLSVDYIQPVSSQQSVPPEPGESGNFDSVSSDGKVNINSATREELMTLPGIGQVLAQRIIGYREANGPFSALSDLLEVEGIGQKKLDDLLDHVTVGG